MPPSVVFFPGATGSGDFWAPVAQRLPSDWKSTSLSWPGAGTVPSVPGINGYEDLLGLAAAEVPAGSDVVAQSMGGVVAIGLALARPEKIRRLVLVATSGGLDVSALGGGDWREEYRSEFPEAAAWVTGERLDYTSLLAGVSLPVCLIWGESDPISPPAVGRALHATLARSTLHVVPGGTHAVARERPDEVAALIGRHLADPAST
jgi:pimeloyl-ACP methyl ester carboxylesterase